jgi:hypothetical protein
MKMRGKGKDDGEGNIIDWAFGATRGTSDYIVKNKTKLGAAGAGGGGFLVGMALGGPVGAVIGRLRLLTTSSIRAIIIPAKN